MARSSKQKPLIVTVFVLTVLVFSAYAAVVSDVYAAELTVEEKGLSILTTVFGLDTANYTVATEHQQDSSFSYLGVVPQETVLYDLTSENSKVGVLYTFANGKLQMMQVLDDKSSTSLTKTPPNANVIEGATEFLRNYQAYTSNSLFRDLRYMLIGVVPGENLTKTSGNTVLEVTANDGYTNFKWYYSENGAVAPYSKFITLEFKDGSLSAFVDNWQFYNVGSTAVNLSEEEAVAVALEAAKAHSWSLKLEATALESENLNESNVCWTSLIFDNSLDANKTRSDDHLELYPVWRVGIHLNKWYGHMYGIQVDVWADTGEVRSVQEAWSTLPPPEGTPIANVSSLEALDSEPSWNSTSPSGGEEPLGSETGLNLRFWVAFPALVAVVTGTGAVWLRKRKNGYQHNWLKAQSLKTLGLMLCIITLSIIALTPIVTVNATTRAGVVWGSESTGAYDEDYGHSWRKSPVEIYWQRQIAGNISLLFGANGYTSINHQGNSGSSRSQILSDLGSLGGYDYTAVVDFDHGVIGLPGQIQGYPVPVPQDEWHYLFEDNTGTIIGNRTHFYTDWSNAIYDMDVNLNLLGNQPKFALINTCLSACIADYVGGSCVAQRIEPGEWPLFIERAVGMPLAWTGRTVADIDAQGFNTTQNISDNGYSTPDWGSQVYMGFPYGSASLSQNIPSAYGSTPYYEWVKKFFQYALNDDTTVNEALNSASREEFGYYFGGCALCTGFTAFWWPDDYQEDCTLAVYGNGRIRLKNFEMYDLTVNAYDASSNPVSADVYIDGGECCGTTGNAFSVTRGPHTVRVDSNSHVFHNFVGHSEFENPIEVQVNPDTTVTANYYTNPPPQYYLYVAAGTGGTTLTPYTPGSYQLTPGIVAVTASPNSGYLFDHWYTCTGNSTDNPLSVTMTSSHYVQAIFKPEPTYKMVSSIYDHSQSFVSNPEWLTGWYPDEQFAIVENYHGQYPTYSGWIIGTMNAQATGHIYMKGYCSQVAEAHIKVYVSFDRSSWTLVGTPLVSGSTPYWINCGTYPCVFNYIKFTTEDIEEMAFIHVDSVQAVP